MLKYGLKSYNLIIKKSKNFTLCITTIYSIMY